MSILENRRHRREFIRVGTLTGMAVLVVSCAPSAAPAPAAPAPGGSAPVGKARWETDWDKLVVDAKREGKLSAITGVGAGYRTAFDDFQTAFGITVEHAGMNASTFAPRALQERKGGIYSYDVMIQPPTSILATLKPEGVLDPIQPVFFRPDVLDDKVWLGGFKAGLTDPEAKWAYGFGLEKARSYWINLNLVKDGEITKVEDLLDPKWKGKIIAGDPRLGGGGWAATAIRLRAGDDSIMKKLFKDQEVAFNRELRPRLEALIKGQYAIQIGNLPPPFTEEFEQGGLMKHIKHIEIDGAEYYGAGNNIAFIFNRPPNPNAAKLYLNWLLTKEGQTLWNKRVSSNSRRQDVEPGDPRLVLTPGKKYLQIDAPETYAMVEKTYDISKEVLK
ncbi:MAG: hypothetical protein AAB289_13540 [Chloroflexota bacterium]